MSRYYVEGRKCCGKNRSIHVAVCSVTAGCMSFRADILFTRSRTAVLSCWPDYWLLAVAGVKGQAVKLACTAHTASWPTQHSTVVAIAKNASLLGSPRNSRAALNLFQKHLLCWQYIHRFISRLHCLKRTKKHSWSVRSACQLDSLPLCPRDSLQPVIWSAGQHSRTVACEQDVRSKWHAAGGCRIHCNMNAMVLPTTIYPSNICLSFSNNVDG